MVTEQPQYSVVVCIFSTSQNTEISLIPNGLRLIYTCSLLLALPCIFHLARHTFATTTTLAKGVPIETVSKMLGHTNIETTQIYARITNNKISNDMQGLDKKFVGIEKIYKEVSMK
ncbi:tyrosine-type recombinase/integrase [Bacteroides salyersiae]|uniref:Tyrosine-type recombinase/integrase n=1 Tax=Bacteroides salyersiae TaxID=291644 RepID=A0A7J4XEW7_9BACE|nr:tyrosine-type recombinase/integrase [Bacteroides salyersiae]KAA3697767.1 tyrosine-type recombinase/integrase [Bacteroides salyersiae]KAA3701749.1 tyrosine-type recombinase/integrase [Bacteroides salyersiae]KAA3707498.1 tyrosine-type recombinase/integrase [Bacteroides salyersiae]KAA3714296.1 tyrosine-type recombinase/integrase [Bacteroides salyersiae]